MKTNDVSFIHSRCSDTYTSNRSFCFFVFISKCPPKSSMLLMQKLWLVLLLFLIGGFVFINLNMNDTVYSFSSFANAKDNTSNKETVFKPALNKVMGIVGSFWENSLSKKKRTAEESLKTVDDYESRSVAKESPNSSETQQDDIVTDTNKKSSHVHANEIFHRSTEIMYKTPNKRTQRLEDIRHEDIGKISDNLTTNEAGDIQTEYTKQHMDIYTKRIPKYVNEDTYRHLDSSHVDIQPAVESINTEPDKTADIKVNSMGNGTFYYATKDVAMMTQYTKLPSHNTTANNSVDILEFENKFNAVEKHRGIDGYENVDDLDEIGGEPLNKTDILINSFNDDTSISTATNTRAEAVTTFRRETPTQNKTQEDIINPFEYKYIHNPEDKCKTRYVRTVFCVPFIPDKFDSRQKYRDSLSRGESVALLAKYPNSNVTMLFFLGKQRYRSKDVEKVVERKIAEEVERYNDIVQVDFVDSYKNLTLKTMSILRWLFTYCNTATFAIKTDPDVLILPAELIRGMEEQYAKRFDNNLWDKFLMGRLAKDEIAHRNPKSKWHVPRSLFNDTTYPVFTYGPTYGFTVSAAEPLFNACIRLPFFYLEDVSTTGLCARKAHIPRTSNVWFHYSHADP